MIPNYDSKNEFVKQELESSQTKGVLWVWYEEFSTAQNDWPTDGIIVYMCQGLKSVYWGWEKSHLQ